jgi:hypothetical protein
MSKDTKIVEEYPPERRITMAIPFKEELYIPNIPRPVFTQFHNMCELTAKTGYEVFTNTDTTTSNTPVTRTLIVNKMKGDWILMMDSDAFPASPDAANRLLAAAKDNDLKIVAAPAVRANYPHMSAFGKFNEDGMAYPFRYGYEFDDEKVNATETSLMEVDWTGFHFVLIHRTVFEKIAFPWFQIGVLDEESGITYGHDVRFCRLAKRAGFTIHVDFATQVGHYNIRPATLADQRWAVNTNPQIKEYIAGLAVDAESLTNITDDEGAPINFIIPDPKDEEGGRPLIDVKVPAPDGIVIPKEALK